MNTLRAPSARLCGFSALLLLAALLRLAYPAWDDLLATHPDERNIVLVTTGLRGLNPYDSGDSAHPQYFAYGHLPVYLLTAVNALVPGDPDPFIRALLAGRALSALADTLTVALVYGLARRFAGYWPALFAAAACALAPLHVQLAHFYAVDTLLAALTTATVLLAVWYAQGGPRATGWGAAVLAGLAIGTKITAVVVLLPVLAAHFYHRGAETQSERRDSEDLIAAAAAATKNKIFSTSSVPRRLCGKICLPLLISLATFALTNPFALLWPEAFAIATSTQLAMASGQLDVPYTRQFAGTWPFVYPFEQLVQWGLGAPLAVLALAGLGYALYRAVRHNATPGEWVVLAWAVPFALLTGASFARFPRYLLPLTPVLCVYAALLLARVARRTRTAALALGVPALAAAGALSVALVASYAQPHPWRVASEWLYAHAAPGQSLAVELWDEVLPSGMLAPGSAQYRFVVLDGFTPVAPESLASSLAASDYVVLSSARVYGVVPRLAEQGDARYAVAACYFRRLFDGGLGFDLVFTAAREPLVGPAGPVDESYSVYDHPRPLVFANRAHLPAAELAVRVAGCAR
jgi:4-amino-4-deoxy-L-arabinose transferase-like glycosyltransferase